MSVCVSEMVSNSVQHSATKLLRVTVSQSDIRWIRVSVTEFDRSLPQMRMADLDEENGRGLV